MQFILIPHYILHCRQCPGSVIIQLFRNKTPVAVSSYGTKIGRHIFSACRINFSFVQRSNAAFKLCRRALAHSAAKPRCTSSLKTPFPIWCIAERQSQLFAMTALLFSLLLCVTPPLHYLLPIGNISKGGIVSGDPPSGLCLSRYCKSKGSHSFCHDCPIIVFITLCDPAVALSVAYRQYIQKAELSVATRHQEFACHVTAKARAVTAFCHDRPIIVFITLCDPAVALSVAYRQYIQRRICQRRPAIRTLLITLLQKQGQSQLFCHDRPIIFFIALCDPAVTLSVAYRQYIQRRNCQRRPAIRTLLVTLLQKQRQSQLFAMTALSFSLLLCVTPPLRYLLPIDNISKGGIVSGDPPH